MKNNTFTAIVLIGLVLIGFSLYNNKVAKEQQRERYVQDSIALARANEQAALAQAAREANLQDANQEAALTATAQNPYQSAFLNEYAHGTPQLSVLENNKIKVTFTSQGARPYAVQVKGYKTYQGDSLILFQGGGNDFSLSFFAKDQLDTKEFYFDCLEATPERLTYRLPVDENAFIEYAYTLPQDANVVQLDVRLMGMSHVVPRNVSQIDLHWHADIRHLEKGFDNEKNYSSMAYKFPNTTDVEKMGLRKPQANENITTKLEWVAFQQQFFSAILFSDQPFTGGNLSTKFYTPGNADSLLLACDAALQIPYQAQDAQIIPLQFYFGPNHFYTLKGYGRSFEKIIQTGGWLVSWISRYVIIPTFNFLNRYMGSFGLIILVMTLLLKLVISPFTFKSYMSTAKMKALKPEIEKINARYPKKEDAMKKQQETMALYKKTGVSITGGCWPMFLQMPILFAMFRFFPGSIELRQEPFLWADDLSGFDSILNLPFKIPLYGDHVSLFALLMAISMYFISKVNMKQQPTTNDQMPGMNGMMLYFMPIMMLLICNNLPAALSYYYLLSNLLSLGQTQLCKSLVNEEELYKKLKAKADKAPAVTKSKFQLRLEEAQRMQQQMQKRK